MSGGVTIDPQDEPVCAEYIMRVYKLNLKSSKWKLLTMLKQERCGHQSTIIEDKIYLVGGNNTYFYENVICQDGLIDNKIIPISKKVTNISSTMSAMNIKRTYFGMCSFAGCIFIAGGFSNKNTSLDKCEIYSTESCEWIPASSMNTKRSRLALIYFQNKIWAMGGTTKRIINDSIETYDLAENKWTIINVKLLKKRHGHQAVVHNKKFFVIGGLSLNEALSSVEIYSSETNQFSFVSPMSQARAFFGCSVFNNTLIVFGGQIATQPKPEVTDSVEVYDIEKQVWSIGPSLPLSLSSFGYASTY